MSRILFAAARGARIEMFTRFAGFEVCFGIPLESEYHDRFRIHPEDEHLQYGPISSALREFAETGKEPYTLSGRMALNAFLHECAYSFVLKDEWPPAQMLALILSEALADEGL